MIFLRPGGDAGNVCWRVPVSAADVGWSCSGGALPFHPWNLLPSLHHYCPPLHKRHYEMLSNALLWFIRARSWVISTKAWKSSSRAAVMSSEADIWLLCCRRSVQESCGLLSSRSCTLAPHHSSTQPWIHATFRISNKYMMKIHSVHPPTCQPWWLTPF